MSRRSTYKLPPDLSLVLAAKQMVFAGTVGRYDLYVMWNGVWVVYQDWNLRRPTENCYRKMTYAQAEKAFPAVAKKLRMMRAMEWSDVSDT